MSIAKKTLIAAAAVLALGTLVQYSGKKVCESYKAYTTLDRTRGMETQPLYSAKFLDDVCQ